MAITKEKRQRIESLVYSIFDQLDKSGENTKKYKNLFKSMDNGSFDTWINAFLANDNEYLTLEVLPYKNEPSLKDIRSAANILDIPFEEYVYYPADADADGKALRTKDKVPVGYLHIKRLQQIVSKKTSYSTSISQRSAITGQVTQESKVARSSDMETQAMMTLEATSTAKELLGARADNRSKKIAMYNRISRDGFVKQSDIDEVGSKFDRSTLNAIDVYLMGAGLKSDLVTDDLLLLGSLLQEDE